MGGWKAQPQSHNRHYGGGTSQNGDCEAQPTSSVSPFSRYSSRAGWTIVATSSNDSEICMMVMMVMMRRRKVSARAFRRNGGGEREEERKGKGGEEV